MAVATEPETGLRCPRCGAALAPDQDWCLQCGAAATTRVLRPPSWKLAAGIILAVVAAVVVAVVLVASSLSDDSHRATSHRAGAINPSTTANAPSTAPTTPTTSTTSASSNAGGGAVQAWPSGRQGWTIVLATESDRTRAEARAKSLMARGVRAGVLDSGRYALSAPTGSFVVFSGQFTSQNSAVSGESSLGGKLPANAYVAQVTPR